MTSEKLRRRPSAAKPALAVVRPIDDAKIHTAYQALEGELRDLERMAILASNLVEETDQWLDREGYQELLLFAVYDVQARAASLRKMYDAGFDQARRS